MWPAVVHLMPEDVLPLVSVLVWVGSGALLLLRSRPSRMSVLTGCMLVANGISAPAVRATDGTVLAPAGRMVLAAALTLAVLTISIFPDARFRPGWLRWVVL